jgi:membrane protein required for colicin V production
MTPLDYFVLTVTAISLTFGLIRGFVQSILAIGATIAGLLAAVTFHEKVAPAVRPYVETDLMATLVAFLGIFLLIVLAGMGIGHFIGKVLKKVHLSWIDHLAGGAFGFLRGWLVASVIYLALVAFPVQLEMVQKAVLAPYLIKGGQVLTYLTSAEMRKRFRDGYETIQQRWKDVSGNVMGKT